MFAFFHVGLRKWAIDRALKIREARGQSATTQDVLRAADELLAFIYGGRVA